MATKPLDWKSPDYLPIYRERVCRLAWLRSRPDIVPLAREHYLKHPWEFIEHFGTTTDPRRIAAGKIGQVPFILWPKQRELLQWMVERWRAGEPGTIVKSRDVGASYLAMALLGTMCVLERNFTGLVISATESKLDRSGDPSTLFAKLREFVRNLPPELQAGYHIDRTDNYMRISFPETGSSVTGEISSRAGRGARASLAIVDESAWCLDGRALDASLAATTNCRLDMSSVNGIANSFYDRAHNAAIPRFDLTWRDDPRKDDAWYAEQAARLDPVVLAQEIDCNFAASSEGVVIPDPWIQAAVGLHERLGIRPSGTRTAGFDVADQGGDANALAIRHGILLEHVESWSGKGADILATTSKAFRIIDERCGPKGVDVMLYDADGIGAGVRGDARSLNAERTHRIKVDEYRGSSAALFPDRIVPGTNRTNADFYGNRKAASWWHARTLFQNAYRASRGEPFDPEMLISINPRIPELARLISELQQATVKESATGKLLINKAPDGTRSPGLADACVIAFAPRVMPMRIRPGVVDAFATPVSGGSDIWDRMMQGGVKPGIARLIDAMEKGL